MGRIVELWFHDYGKNIFPEAQAWDACCSSQRIGSQARTPQGAGRQALLLLYCGHSSGRGATYHRSKAEAVPPRVGRSVGLAGGGGFWSLGQMSETVGENDNLEKFSDRGAQKCTIKYEKYLVPV